MARTTAHPTLKVLVIDDHSSFAQAVSMAIGLHDGIEAIGHTTSIEAGVRAVLVAEPDVVVIDWQLPEADGIEGIRRIKAVAPSTRCLMLTGHAGPGLRQLALAAGAAAMLPKESSVAQIVDAIRRCATEHQLDDLGEDGDTADADGLPTLTPRETEVLWLLATGKDTPTIARTLYLSVHTVRGYVKGLSTKLGAHSQLEAVSIARRFGLIPDQP